MINKDKQKTYSLQQFELEFPTEDACLDKIFQDEYGDLTNCLKCGEDTTYNRITTRRAYQSSCPCHYQIYPCVNTIFEKSRIPLRVWFKVMFLFGKSKNGISAKEVQRIVGCCYRTAWRMLMQIRKTMTQDHDMTDEDYASCDECFIGGKNQNRHTSHKPKHNAGKSLIDKQVVMGMYFGSGKVYAQTVLDTTTKSLAPIIYKKLKPQARLITDENKAYHQIGRFYKHESVDHGKGQYVTESLQTTNHVEGFWGVLKRGVKGTYIKWTRNYIQCYIDECVFRFNHRESENIFADLFKRIRNISGESILTGKYPTLPKIKEITETALDYKVVSAGKGRVPFIQAVYPQPKLDLPDNW